MAADMNCVISVVAWPESVDLEQCYSTFSNKSSNSKFSNDFHKHYNCPVSSIIFHIAAEAEKEKAYLNHSEVLEEIFSVIIKLEKEQRNWDGVMVVPIIKLWLEKEFNTSV